MHDLHRAVSQQPGGNFGGGAPPRGVAIQHENHALETLPEHSLLRLVQGRSHQRDDRPDTGLAQSQAVKETFDQHHDGFRGGGRTVEVEDSISALAKPAGKR